MNGLTESAIINKQGGENRMKEMNQKGVSRGPAMSVKRILAASVFILVLASFLLVPGRRASADVILDTG